jgi:hypothetical protein
MQQAVMLVFTIATALSRSACVTKMTREEAVEAQSVGLQNCKPVISYHGEELLTITKPVWL